MHMLAPKLLEQSKDQLVIANIEVVENFVADI